MAYSGSISKQFLTVGASTYTLKWSYELTQYNASTSTSTIKWQADLIASGASSKITSTYAHKWELKIVHYDNMGTLNFTDYAVFGTINANTTKTIASGTFDIPHGYSSRGLFDVYFELDTDGITYASTSTNVVEVILEDKFRLGDPPKSGSALAFPSFTDEDSPVIQYTYGVGVTKMEATIRVDGFLSNVRTLPAGSDSYIFEFTDDERTRIRNAVTTSNSHEAILTLTSYFSSSSTDISTLKSTCHIINAVPVLNPTVTDNNGREFILYDSNSLTVNWGAVGQKGATIKDGYVSCGSQKLRYGIVGGLNWDGTGTLTNITSNQIIFTAIDSRGNSTSTTVSVNLIPYVRLTCNIDTSYYTLNDDRTITLKFDVTGMFYNGDFNDGGSPNALTLHYRTKFADGNFGSWTWIDKSIVENTYFTTIEVTTEEDKAVYLEVMAEDSMNSVTASFQGSKPLPLFDWGEDSFNFNIPITYKGSVVPLIVEEGEFRPQQYVDETFYYRKWSDGWAEIWGRMTLSNVDEWPVNNAWGSLYTSGPQRSTNITFPFAFSEKPYILAQLEPGWTGAFLGVAGGSGTTASTTNTGTYEILRATQLTSNLSSIEFSIAYYIRGRWM